MLPTLPDMGYSSPKQMQAFYRKLGPKLRFLYLAREYLNRIGVPPDDELYKAVEKAHDAVHAVSVTAFYRSGVSGVGQEPRSDSNDGKL